MRRFIPVAICLMLPALVGAANLVGDAENDGDVDMSDAGLVQSRLYGTTDAWGISPLALADNDGDLDLKDLLLVAQAAGGVRTIEGPGNLFSYLDPSTLSTESGVSAFPIFWGVFSNHAAAENTDGLATSISKVPATLESSISNASPTVSGFAALTLFSPANSQGADEFHNLRLKLDLLDSSGAWLDTDTRNALILVGPSVCGNNWVQPGEDCEEGEVETATCDPDCTAPACADGYRNVSAGEVCDDGNTVAGDGCSSACGCESVASFPFLDDFESGALQCWWTATSSSLDGRIRVSTSYSPPNGSYHLLMDANSININARNEATLAINLAGIAKVSVDFQDREYSEIDQALPSTWTGSYNGDGVAVSVDGVNWVRAHDLADSSSTYTLRSFDLVAVLASQGLSPANPTYIRFQQYDGWAIPLRGRGFDDIRVFAPVCGDGISEVPEACDDGNTVSGDGCRGDCEGVEVCGDALVDIGEFCDDGALEGEGSCLGDCNSLQTCGDSAMDGNEACDDGNTAGGDGCRADCLGTEQCYDGLLDVGEACDSGGWVPPNVGNNNSFQNLYEVFVVGDKLYAADESDGLIVYDISTDDPGVIGYTTVPGYAGGVWVDGSRAYVALFDSGMGVYDISSTPPVFVGGYDTPGTVRGIFATATRAYVADGNSGLQVLDVSTGAPSLVGTYNTSGQANDVMVVGTRAYVADGPGGLLVLDVSTDTATFVGNYDTPGTAQDVAIVGNAAYVADGWGGLIVLDISTDIPTLLGSYPVALGDYFHAVYISGNRAYLGGWSGEAIQIFDISTPTPVLLTTISGVDTEGVWVQGNRLYTGSYGGGLDVYDITEPCGNQCAAPACGDEVVSTGEACDDGNTADGDGCRADCLGTEVCGDGLLDVGEVCDDGNNADGDGCRAHCLGMEICGDGLLDAGEACDDGNTASDDGCRTDCLGTEVCGDGLLDVGEACDDGNTTGGDGCRADCLGLEVCGDGLLDVGEVCDDGAANGTGEGFCVSACDAVQLCGDSLINGTEACDDGADNGVILLGGGTTSYYNGHQYSVYNQSGNQAAAEAQCAADGGHLVTLGDNQENAFLHGVTGQIAWIGLSDPDLDGVFEWVTGEPFVFENWMMDEPTIGVDDCAQTRVVNATWRGSACSASLDWFVCEYELGFCSAFCDGPICGDGIANAPETCDDGPDNGLGAGYCNAGCLSRSGCGDGTLEGSEVCDDGANNGAGPGFCLADCSGIAP